MKRGRSGSLTLSLAVALAAAVFTGGVPAEEPAHRITPPVAPPAEDNAGRAEDAVPGSGGIRVHLDPETGEIRSRPSEADAEPGAEAWPLDPRQRLSRYGGDLLQEAVPLGGYKVDLRGRFQSAVVATIDPETDTVTIDCVSRPASTEASDE